MAVFGSLVEKNFGLKLISFISYKQNHINFKCHVTKKYTWMTKITLSLILFYLDNSK